MRLVGEESCLFLNVWSPPPDKCRGASCAVMFWIHGGAYVTGAGREYNATGIVAYAQDVVVVTVNYRLGALGFLGSEALRGRDEGSGSTGNYGIQDQRAALLWVRQNVRQFGGDAGNVMIFGESAGGGSVSMHLTMQRSWSLYHKAAIESGAYSYWTAQPMQEAQQQYEDLLAATGCAARGGLKCLAALDAATLTQISWYWLPWRPRPYGCNYAPTVDGVELQRFPWELRDEGHFNTGVPVLLGYNKDEGTIGIDGGANAESKVYEKVSDMTSGDFVRLITGLQFKVNQRYLPEILGLYSVNRSGGDPDYTSWYWVATHFAGDYHYSCPSRRTGRAINKFSRSKLFLYYFAHTPRTVPFPWAGVKGHNKTAGASHASELEFVFLATDGKPDGMGHRLIGDDEKLLSKTMAGYWINFARTSDPNLPGRASRPLRTNLTIAWEPFTASREASIRLDLPALSAAVGRNDLQCDIVDKLGVVTASLSATAPRISAPTPEPAGDQRSAGREMPLMV